MSALNSGRQTAAVLCLAAVFVAAVAIVSSADDVPGWVFTLFLLVQLPMSRVYPTTGAPLPRRLHPHGIRVPAGTAA